MQTNTKAFEEENVMNALTELTKEYLQYCHVRKGLSPKTLRAYRTDLEDFRRYMEKNNVDFLVSHHIGEYIDTLHCSKAPRTVKRKIASIQAFYQYLVYTDKIAENPLKKLDLSFKLPRRLPRYIPNHIMNTFYQELYSQKNQTATLYQLKCATRNIAVIELLFATGLRISELCGLKKESVNLYEQEIYVHGKGNKERIIQLTEEITINALHEYSVLFEKELKKSEYFFLNKYGHPLSAQSVRNMINQLADAASITMHITPHMFRHSFATCLVNQDVDIRCIQEILGHSSIRTTEIYTHVNMAKQKSVLATKNPRKSLDISIT